MKDYIKSTSNNISFPAKKRNVLVLIDGEQYRLEVSKRSDTKLCSDGEHIKNIVTKYALFEENDPNFIVACANLELQSGISHFSQKFLKQIGFDDVPDEYFELKEIRVDKSYRSKGLGTKLLNYVMCDIVLFNLVQGRNIKLLFQRSDTDITKPFYAKFGARENINVEKFNKYKNSSHRNITPMIIDEPKIMFEPLIELADDFDYASVGEESPFGENGSFGDAGSEPGKQ